MWGFLRILCKLSSLSTRSCSINSPTPRAPKIIYMLMAPRYACPEGLSLLNSPHDRRSKCPLKAPHCTAHCCNINTVHYPSEHNNKKALLPLAFPISVKSSTTITQPPKQEGGHHPSFLPLSHPTFLPRLWQYYPNRSPCLPSTHNRVVSVDVTPQTKTI